MIKTSSANSSRDTKVRYYAIIACMLVERESSRFEPNCIGFVLSKLGFIDSDRFVTAGSYESYLEVFEETGDVSSADAIAVVNRLSNRVNHLALVDKEAPDSVIHRPGTGKDVVREEIGEVLDRYPSEFFAAVFLRAKSR